MDLETVVSVLRPGASLNWGADSVGTSGQLQSGARTGGLGWASAGGAVLAELTGRLTPGKVPLGPHAGETGRITKATWRPQK